MSMMYMFLALLFGAISCQAQRTIPQRDRDGRYSVVSVQNVVHATSRYFLLNVHGTPNDLTHQDLILMADLFKITYQSHHNYCRSIPFNHGRLSLTDFEILPDYEITGYYNGVLEPPVVVKNVDFSFIVRLDFICRGCQATGFDVFESSETASVHTTSYQVPFPSETYYKPCVPDRFGVVYFFSEAIMEAGIAGIDKVHNVYPLQLGTEVCDVDDAKEEKSEFVSQLTIAFYGDIHAADLNDQLAIVEQLFIPTYNELNALNPTTCDPHSRIVTNATAQFFNPHSDSVELRGYKWYFLKLSLEGTCYDCVATNPCLTEDILGQSTCDSSNQQQRRRLSARLQSPDSCYCSPGEANNPVLPTNKELELALEEQFEVFRSETNFTLIQSIVYLSEVDVPDSCCGWPVYNNLQVDVNGEDFQNAVSTYFSTGNSVYGTPINCWDVSNVVDMTYAFDRKKSFKGPLNCWDTSKVQSMEGLLAELYYFNGDVSHWNTSQVTTMSWMFFDARVFNGDLSHWDTSRVTDMSRMFAHARMFNGDLSNWNTSQVNDMSGMFDRATSFEGDGLSEWDTGKVKTMEKMFQHASYFNGTLSLWDTSHVQDMSDMFHSCLDYNDDLYDWDTSQVQDMTSMFETAVSFNGNISQWNTKNVKTTKAMFNSAQIFNCDLSKWDTGNVTNMDYMFLYAYYFNSNIYQWDTSKVTSMRAMFYDAHRFKGYNLYQWDISKVVDMQLMFQGTYSFRQNLCPWRFIADNLNYTISTDIFLNSDCRHTVDPVPEVGPWCFHC